MHAKVYIKMYLVLYKTKEEKIESRILDLDIIPLISKYEKYINTDLFKLNDDIKKSVLINKEKFIHFLQCYYYKNEEFNNIEEEIIEMVGSFKYTNTIDPSLNISCFSLISKRINDKNIIVNLYLKEQKRYNEN